MANVLTSLAADIYKAADIIGRQQVGFIPSVTINAGTEGVAQGDTIRSAFTRAPTVNSSYTPSMTIPQGDDQTVDNKTATIDLVANVQIPWTGEDIKHVANGAGFETIYGDQIKQAMKVITDSIEANVALYAKRASSRAYGTAGTTPFASNHNEMAFMRQILVDNGTPMDGQVSLVINTAAGANMRNLALLQKASESGGTELLRNGTLLDLQGLMIKESGGIVTHTKGAATGALINNASTEAVGQTSLTLDTITVNTTGILAGDVVTFAVDSANKYVVNTGLVATSGDIVIAPPGVRVALPDNNAMTIGNSYTPNMAFHRSAIELAVRPPSQPFGGDAAVDRMTVQDPFSGLVYEIAVYKGYGKTMFDITVLYGIKVWKPEFVATLIG